MEHIIISSIQGVFMALAAIVVLVTIAAIVKMFWEAAPDIVDRLSEVRWKVVFFHTASGFMVSVLVAPQMGLALAIAAGLTATFIVAAVMHQLQQIEVRKTVRSRVRR